MRIFRLFSVVAVVAILVAPAGPSAAQQGNPETDAYFKYLTAAEPLNTLVQQYFKSLGLINSLAYGMAEGKVSREDGLQAYKQVIGKIEVLGINIIKLFDIFPPPPLFETPNYATMAASTWKHLNNQIKNIDDAKNRSTTLFNAALSGRATKEAALQVVFANLGQLLKGQNTYLNAQKLALDVKEPAYHLVDMDRTFNSVLIMTMWWMKLDMMPPAKRPAKYKDHNATVIPLVGKLLKNAQNSLKKGVETAARFDSQVVKNSPKGRVTPDVLSMVGDLRKSYMSSMNVEERLITLMRTEHAKGMKNLADQIFNEETELQSLWDQLNTLNQDRADMIKASRKKREQGI